MDTATQHMLTGGFSSQWGRRESLWRWQQDVNRSDHLPERPANEIPPPKAAESRRNETSTRQKIYSALDRDREEIRLLVVKAGSGPDRLQCELRHAFLRSNPKPEYETASWCWGDHSLKAEILLNGIATMVPANAEETVRRMRKADGDRVLWMDALCIDQENIHERGHQMSLMYQIYSHGRRNLIWLGRETETTAEALDSMKLVLNNAREETEDLQKFASTIYDEHGQTIFAVSPGRFDVNINAKGLAEIYARPWFRRLWVVQEAALSQENICLCGPHEVNLRDILMSASWLYHKQDFLSVPMFNEREPFFLLDMFRLVDRQYGRSSLFSYLASDLLTLVSGLQDFEVSCPEDHIFGLLGLFQASKKSSNSTRLLDPEQDKPLNHVLRDATRVMIEQRLDLSVFQYAGRTFDTASEDDDLPSWVPSWHRRRNEKLNAWELQSYYAADDGEGFDEWLLSHSQNPDVLCVQGFSVDTISDMASVFGEEFFTSGKTTAHTLVEVQGLFNKTNNGSINAEDDARLGRTLICEANSNFERADEVDWADMRKWSAYITAHGELPPSLQRLHQSNVGPEDDMWKASRYTEAFHCAARNRRFFTTASGHIGLGPRTMETDDIVAIVYGSKWPVVFQRDGEFCRIKGVCYVDGIMDGEALRKHRAEGKEDVVFLIR